VADGEEVLVVPRLRTLAAELALRTFSCLLLDTAAFAAARLASVTTLIPFLSGCGEESTSLE
jgi:hypothetical protein